MRPEPGKILLAAVLGISLLGPAAASTTFPAHGSIELASKARFAAAHNKVMIADAAGPGCAVVTGSYNFTWPAQKRNAENVPVLRDNCPLAETNFAYWRRHRAAATPVSHLPWKP